jgi:hypothetical protein
MMRVPTKSLLSGALPLRSTLITRAFASVGDKIPNVELHKGFPPKKINIRDYCENKSVILLGLPVRSVWLEGLCLFEGIPTHATCIMLFLL